MARNPHPGLLGIGPRRLGGLQAAVLDVLWTDGGWRSPARVREALGNNRAYTTIMTVLVRMAKQGFVERRTAGNGYEYRAARSRGEFGSTRILSVLAEAEDSDATLARFVAHLEPEELDALRAAVDNVDLDDGT